MGLELVLVLVVTEVRPRGKQEALEGLRAVRGLMAVVAVVAIALKMAAQADQGHFGRQLLVGQQVLVAVVGAQVQPLLALMAALAVGMVVAQAPAGDPVQAILAHRALLCLLTQPLPAVNLCCYFDK